MSWEEKKPTKQNFFLKRFICALFFSDVFSIVEGVASVLCECAEWLWCYCERLICLMLISALARTG